MNRRYNDYEEDEVEPIVERTGLGKLGLVVIAIIAFGLIVAFVWYLVAESKKEPVQYSCFVDTNVLGALPIDACAMVPIGVRQRNNVIVTGGSTVPSITKVEDGTLYYSVLTVEQQIVSLTKTPRILQPLKRIGYFGMFVSGIMFTILLGGIMKLKKKYSEAREKISSKSEDEMISKKETPVKPQTRRFEHVVS